MYGSRAVTPLVLISDDVINRILKLDIQTNILVYVTRCCTDLTSKVLKEMTFGLSSALLYIDARGEVLPTPHRNNDSCCDHLSFYKRLDDICQFNETFFTILFVHCIT